ncbi:MAG TPA: hypothetical protein VIF62_12650 [Labilithrix sp.]
MRAWISGFAAAALLFATQPAAAQNASRAAAAEALFQEGKRHMASGNYPQACASFAKSQELDPGAGTLLNLAGCYEKNNQMASAWATWKEASSASEATGRKDWAAKARARAEQLEPKLSRIVVVVPSKSVVEGLVVKRDGIALGAAEWGVATPVDAGEHVVEASAPERASWRTAVRVASLGERLAVEIPVLAPAPASAAAQPTPTPSVAPAPVQPAPPGEDASSARGGTQRALGIALGVTGLVGVGVGSVFGLVASSHRDDATRNCNADLSVCTTQGAADMRSARSSATVSTIAFVAGGALAAGGIVLWLTAPSERATAVGVGPASVALFRAF